MKVDLQWVAVGDQLYVLVDHGATDSKERRVGSRATILQFPTHRGGMGTYLLQTVSTRDGVSFGAGSRLGGYWEEHSSLAAAKSAAEKKIARRAKRYSARKATSDLT